MVIKLTTIVALASLTWATMQKQQPAYHDNLNTVKQYIIDNSKPISKSNFNEYKCSMPPETNWFGYAINATVQDTTKPGTGPINTADPLDILELSISLKDGGIILMQNKGYKHSKEKNAGYDDLNIIYPINSDSLSRLNKRELENKFGWLYNQVVNDFANHIRMLENDL